MRTSCYVANVYSPYFGAALHVTLRRSPVLRWPNLMSHMGIYDIFVQLTKNVTVPRLRQSSCQLHVTLRLSAVLRRLGFVFGYARVVYYSGHSACYLERPLYFDVDSSCYVPPVCCSSVPHVTSCHVTLPRSATRRWQHVRLCCLRLLHVSGRSYTQRTYPHITFILRCMLLLPLPSQSSMLMTVHDLLSKLGDGGTFIHIIIYS